MYRKLSKSKIRRMKKYYEKQARERKKLAKDNRKDLNYASGLTGPFKDDNEQGGNKETELTEKKRAKNKKTKEKAAATTCPHCGILGHSRRNSRSCLKNKETMARHATARKNGEAREKGKS